MKEGELFMPFAPNTRSRSWMVTIQVANMENAGLTKEEYENAELLANFMIETWEHHLHGAIQYTEHYENHRK